MSDQSQSRIARANEWLGKWNPRLGLVVDYFAYFLGIYMLLWSIWGETIDLLPSLPLFEVMATDTRMAVLVVGILLWGTGKDAAKYQKQQVFGQ